MGSKTLALKKPWIRCHYHSTYSNFTRCVSILVHKSFPFRLLDLLLDSEGRYVIIHAQIRSMKWVIAGVYLPPPASLSLLHQITSKIAALANDNMAILGDFNMVPDLNVDRMSASGYSHSFWVSEEAVDGHFQGPLQEYW